MSYKLYTYWKSTTSWRARIAINLKNIKPEYIFVDLLRGKQKQGEYRNVNPNQGVPSLMLPNGTILIQSLPIIQYLDQVYPFPNPLFPKDPIIKAQVRGFCQIINSAIHPYQNLRLLQKLQAEYNIHRNIFPNYFNRRGLTTLQSMLQKSRGKYTFGNQITAADICLYPQAYAAQNRFGVSLKEFKHISEVVNNLKLVKQFVQAEPQNQPDYDRT